MTGMIGTCFPGLLGRRVRYNTEEPGPDAWRGVVVGWDEGYLAIETPRGEIELNDYRCLIVESRGPVERPPPTSHASAPARDPDDPGPGVRV